MNCVAGMGMEAPELRAAALHSCLSNACRTGTLVARPAGGLVRKLDTIDHFEKGLRARLDDVRADARAPVCALIVLDVDDGLALGILALGDASHFELAQGHIDAGGRLDGLERGIDGPVARDSALHSGAV